MTSNISEFERTKPTGTVKFINETIKFYEKSIPDMVEIANVQDELVRELSLEFVSKLKTIKYKLLNGE